MKIDGPHLVEVQVHMEHVVEKGKKEEMTTHWSEHKVKSDCDEVTHAPDAEDLFTCSKCGEEVTAINV